MAVALFNQRIMPLARYMGWEAAFVAGREKLLAGDRAGAAEVFTDDMIDAVAITGRPDQAREQLTGWAEVYDTPVLFAPSGPRTDDYLQRALETFAI
jgi:alkanesulfonate monooxygenase SsuD/methylene tetrahydromethanopterin reductase-like flavin-dependent oxidoreductase (luciferase family)